MGWKLQYTFYKFNSLLTLTNRFESAAFLQDPTHAAGSFHLLESLKLLWYNNLNMLKIYKVNDEY